MAMQLRKKKATNLVENIQEGSFTVLTKRTLRSSTKILPANDDINRKSSKKKLSPIKNKINKSSVSKPLTTSDNDDNLNSKNSLLITKFFSQAPKTYEVAPKAKRKVCWAVSKSLVVSNKKDQTDPYEFLADSPPKKKKPRKARKVVQKKTIIKKNAQIPSELAPLNKDLMAKSTPIQCSVVIPSVKPPALLILNTSALIPNVKDTRTNMLKKIASNFKLVNPIAESTPKHCSIVKLLPFEPVDHLRNNAQQAFDIDSLQTEEIENDHIEDEIELKEKKTLTNTNLSPIKPPIISRIAKISEIDENINCNNKCTRDNEKKDSVCKDLIEELESGDFTFSEKDLIEKQQNASTPEDSLHSSYNDYNPILGEHVLPGLFDSPIKISPIKLADLKAASKGKKVVEQPLACVRRLRMPQKRKIDVISDESDSEEEEECEKKEIVLKERQDPKEVEAYNSWVADMTAKLEDFENYELVID